MELQQRNQIQIGSREAESRMTILPSSSTRSLGVEQQEQQALTIQRQAVKQLSVQYRGYTPAIAFQSDEPSIHALIVDNGIEEVEGVFTLHLVALSRYLNLKAGLTEDQIDYIVEKLTTDYEWFKMADFAIIIDRIKSNKYGDFYENFNGNKFLDIVAQYDQERTMEIERIRSEENNAFRQSFNSDNMKLPYYIGKDGRIHLTPKREEEITKEQQEREAIRAESERKEQISKKVFEDARKIQEETGCTIMEAYNTAMQQNIEQSNQ